MEPSVHDLTAAYALDALDPAERARYEPHLATCPACQEELASFWEVAAALAHGAGGPAPAPQLRERIRAQARSERTNVVPFRRRFALPVASGIAAVAAVAALGLGLWSSSLARDLDRTRDERDAQAQGLAVLADPSARQVGLSGGNGRLVVSSNGRAAMVITGLAAAPTGKIYEVWVIEDGVALAAGLFNGTGDRTVVSLERSVPADAVVAVTLEDGGGAAAPTGEPLFSTAV